MTSKIRLSSLGTTNLTSNFFVLIEERHFNISSLTDFSEIHVKIQQLDSCNARELMRKIMWQVLLNAIVPHTDRPKMGGLTKKNTA